MGKLLTNEVGLQMLAEMKRQTAISEAAARDQIAALSNVWRDCRRIAMPPERNRSLSERKRVRAASEEDEDLSDQRRNQVPGLHTQADEHRKSYPDNRSEQCQAGAKEAPAYGRPGKEG